MRHRDSKRIVLAAAVTVIGAALVILGAISLGGAEERGYVPDPEIAAAEGQTIAADSLVVEQEFEQPPGEVRWSVITYLSSAGPCLDVYGELVSGGDAATVGGCGAPDEPFRMGVGQVWLADRPYTVAYGQPPLATTVVKVTLADGTITEVTPSDGIFVYITAGEVDVTLVEAVDALGNVIDTERPPSLSGFLRDVPTPESPSDST